MGLDDEGMRTIELKILRAPDAQPLMVGLKGVRKARFALPGRGKSGGGRLICYLAVGETVYFMTAYPKSERDDLSPEQRKAILATIETLKGLKR